MKTILLAILLLLTGGNLMAQDYREYYKIEEEDVSKLEYEQFLDELTKIDSTWQSKRALSGGGTSRYQAKDVNGNIYWVLTILGTEYTSHKIERL